MRRSRIGKLSDKLEKGALRPPIAEEQAKLDADKERRQEQSAQAKQDRHDGTQSFHEREAEKYESRAAELEAAGKHKAAERARKVAARNRAKLG